MSWTRVGSTDPDALRRARLELHWAAQTIEATARSLVEPQPEDEHTSATWVDELGAIAGRPTRTSPPVRVGLRVADLELLVLDADEAVVRTRKSLAGMTLDEAFGWLAGEIDPDATLERPSYDLPEHPVGDGERFEGVDPEARAEIARWFSNAQTELSEIAAREPDASPVRLWPHHFDIATLISLDPDASGDDAPSVNVGLSPGDESCDEPYWYVAPWPVPQPEDLPPLDVAAALWHTHDYVAALLPARHVVAATAQRDTVRSFLSAAIRASKKLTES